jgi:hypothetical protein
MQRQVISGYLKATINTTPEFISRPVERLQNGLVKNLLCWPGFTYAKAVWVQTRKI